MDELIPAKDWSKSPIGTREDWPTSLHTAVTICLASETPSAVCWGNDLILIYNDAWRKLIGDKHPEALGQPIREIFDESTRRVIKPSIEQALSSGEPTEVRNKSLSLFGDKKHLVDCLFTPILNENHSNDGVFIVASSTQENDSKATQQARARLRKSEGKYRTLFESIDEGFCIIKVIFDEGDNPVDYKFLEVNPAFENHTGIKNAEGKRMRRIAPNHEQYWFDIYGKVALSREPARFDYPAEALERFFDVYAFPFGEPEERKVAVLFNDISKRKQAEEALQESREQLEMATKAASVGTWNWDIQEDVVTADENLAEIYGMDPAEAAAGAPMEAFYDTIHEDDEKETWNKLIQAVEETGELEAEYRIWDANGELLWVLARGKVEYEDGEPVRMYGAVTDITGRKQAEDQLKKNEEYLQLAIDVAQLGTWYHNLETGRVFLDARMRLMWGVSDEFIPFQEVMEYIHPEDRERVTQAINTALDPQASDNYAINYRILDDDGSIRWISANGQVQFTGKENERKPVTFFGTAQDITGQKRTEKTLRENQARLRLACEAAGLGVFEWDPQKDDIKWENDRMYEIFKQNPKEGPVNAAGFLNEFVHPDDAGDFEAAIEEALQSDQFHFMGRLQRNDGELRWIEFTGQVERDEDGTPVRMPGIAADITERKQRQDELEAMNQTLEEQVEQRTEKLRSLAAELSQAEEQERHRLAAELHDNLGQMLSVAKMNADGLQMFDLPESPAKGIADLSELIADALSYTRELMSELKPPPVLDKEDIRPVVDWVVEKMEEHGLEVTIEDDNHPKPLNRDVRTAVYQGIREILINVVKHADVNKARLTMSRDNHKLNITIEDRGRGFDTKKQKTTPTKEGGFGLFNIRERMNWFGGSFEISSEPGQGTEVRLTAPLKESQPETVFVDIEEETVPPRSRNRQYDVRQRINIVLVDDHEMMRSGLRQMIEKQDDMRIVAEAENGQEAVEISRNKHPDVVVMDVNMPVMDGIEATRKIKAGYPDVTVIGLSLHDKEEVIRDMKNAGASDYLTKDEAFETLCETIRDIISQR